jgi:hypothetical protein
LNLAVSPAGLSEMHFNLADDYAELHKNTDFEMFFSDKW